MLSTCEIDQELVWILEVVTCNRVMGGEKIISVDNSEELRRSAWKDEL